MVPRGDLKNRRVYWVLAAVTCVVVVLALTRGGEDASGATSSAPAGEGRRRRPPQHPGAFTVHFPKERKKVAAANYEDFVKNVRHIAGREVHLMWYEVRLASGQKVRVEVDAVSFEDLTASDVVHLDHASAASAEAAAKPTHTDYGEWKGWPEQSDNKDVEEVELTPEQKAAGCSTKRRPFHIVVTTTSSTYEQWLSRVMYYWYKKQKARDVCGEMGGFTRLLHSPPDNLMDEIPTVSVPRLDDGRACNATGENTCDLGFIVLNRPTAFREWLARIDSGEVTIKEKWVLLCEPDHFILKPIPNIPRLTFHFPYMHAFPRTPQAAAIKPYLPRGFPPKNLAPGGPSPCMLHIDDWRKITPLWYDISFKLRRTWRAEQAYGWVLEMWGFVSAAVNAGIDLIASPVMQQEPCSVRGWQCPQDISPLGRQEWLSNRTAGPFIAHITHAMDFEITGQSGIAHDAPKSEKENPPWAFNKRHYGAGFPPKNLFPPPEAVTAVFPSLIPEMVNEASSALPDWGRLNTGSVGFGRNTCRDEFLEQCKAFPNREWLKKLGFP